MTPLITGSVPEQGQLVTVRQRRYVVTEVAKSTLPDRWLKVPADADWNSSEGILGTLCHQVVSFTRLQP